MLTGWQYFRGRLGHGYLLLLELELGNGARKYGISWHMFCIRYLDQEFYVPLLSLQMCTLTLRLVLVGGLQHESPCN